MKELIFSTGNADKFSAASKICAQYDIHLSQSILEIDEIQGEDPASIVTDKAKKAFTLLHKSVIVSDDSWEIPALRGFPGPYMKSINHWFSADDFLRLTAPLEDKTIYLNSLLAFADGHYSKIFTHRYPGTILSEARGSHGQSSAKIISMDGDNGKTIAEIYDTGAENTGRDRLWASWHNFAKWYSTVQ